MSDIGESVIFIGFVYTGVLIPWSLLYFHDFLSEKWVRVGRAIFHGWVHAMIAFIPTPILLVYIIMQSRLKPDPDYKEMFAAISAVFFSVFHLMRSIWGIIKLISFRRWAIKVTKSFESASYPFEDDNTSLPLSMTSDNNDYLQQKDRSNLISRFKPISNNLMNRSYSSKTSNTTGSIPLFFADSRESSFEDDSGLSLLTSQNTSSSNRVYCSLFIRDRFKTFCRYVKKFFRRLFSIFRKKDDNHERIFKRVNNILINHNIVDNEIIGSSAPEVNIYKLTITPNDPLKNFVYWTVPYLAQLGRLWFREAKFYQYPTQEWNGQRQALATEVWGAAVFGMEKDFEGKRGNIDSESILDPEDFKKLISNDRGDIFSKNDIVQMCFSKRDGMPFEKPIFEFSVDQDRMRAQISAHMKQIATSLPANLADIASKLTPQHLEWFAIFASVEEWKGLPRTKKVRTERPSRFSRNFNRQAQVSKLKTKEQNSFSKTITENDVPVFLIQDQLGLDQSPPISHCAFPFVHRTYGKLLWEQKTVLQVSVRIDNWIALSVGEELQSLLTNEKVLEEFNSDPDTEDQDQEEELNQSALGKINEDALNSEEKIDQTIFKRHEKLETTRLQYQLVQHAKNHHEQGLSFMGCVVETIRSKMAEALPQLYAKESNSPKDWEPQIPDEKVKVDFSEQLSKQLSKFFTVCNNKETLEGPFISYSMKERLLWECQNAIYWAGQTIEDDKIQRISSKSRPQESMRMMMLFILGYPSITIETMCVNQDDDDHALVVALLRPVAAPQDIQIRVTLNRGTNGASHDDEHDIIGILEIVRTAGNHNISANDLTFQWQAWRDAFEGRLRGKAVWQRNHFMRNLRVHHTTMPITKGIVSQADGRYLTWKGWEPFRAGLSTFELKYCSLIIIEDELRMSSRIQRLQRSASAIPPSANQTFFASSLPTQQRDEAIATSTTQNSAGAPIVQLRPSAQRETIQAGYSTEQSNPIQSRPNDNEAPGSSSNAQQGVTPALQSGRPGPSSSDKTDQVTFSIHNHDKNDQQSNPQIQPTLAVSGNKQITSEPSRKQIESNMLLRSRTTPISSNPSMQVPSTSATNNQPMRAQAQLQNTATANAQRNKPDISTSFGAKPVSSDSASSVEGQIPHFHRVRSSTFMSYDYDKATIVELTDASLHLNGLLNLDTIIEKSDNPLDPDYELGRDQHIKAKAPETRKEGTQSTDSIWDNKSQVVLSNLQIRSQEAQTTVKTLPVPLKDLVDDTWRKAQRQDPDAMYRLATWYLEGSHTHHVNKNKALLLLKRSLVIGKTMMTAKLYVSTLLQIANENNNVDQKSLVDRALWAVNFLWRDIEQGQNIDKLGRKKSTWKKTNETIAEKEKRMLNIIQLNRRILRTRSNAEMMLAFGTRLHKHDTTKSQDYRSEAISLFESAIIANCDETAMLRLVALKAAEDVNYARLLYYSALATHKRKCYCQGSNKKDSAELLQRLRYIGSLKPEEEAKHKEFQNERGRLGELQTVDDNIRMIMNRQSVDTVPPSQLAVTTSTTGVSTTQRNVEIGNNDDRREETDLGSISRPEHVAIDIRESDAQSE